MKVKLEFASEAERASVLSALARVPASASPEQAEVAQGQSEQRLLNGFKNSITNAYAVGKFAIERTKTFREYQADAEALVTIETVILSS